LWNNKLNYFLRVACLLGCVYPGFSKDALDSALISASHFKITHPTHGNYCAPVPITVQAVTEKGGIASEYFGVVKLFSGVNAGSWQLVSGHGTFTPGVNDGTALYQFDSKDHGVAHFSLSNRSNAPLIHPVVAQANDATIRSDMHANDGIKFSDFGFLVATKADSFNENRVESVTSGKSFKLHLKAMHLNDGACHVLDLNDTVTISPFLQYIDPVSPPIPAAIKTVDNMIASSGIPVTFAHGVASVELSYDDVGMVQVGLSAGSAGVLKGLSPLLVSMPASLRITRAESIDELDTTDLIVKKVDGVDIFDPLIVPLVQSGKKLRVSVMPQNARGKFTPSFGHESTPSRIVLQSTLHPSLAPWGRNGRHNDGVMRHGKSFDYTNGDNVYGYTNDKVAYDEVGLTMMAPALEGGKYMGVRADNLVRPSETIGRFVPAYFSVESTASKLTAACPAGHFTYIGQPIAFDTAPALNISPRTVDGKGINNYQYQYCRLCPKPGETTRAIYYQQGNPTVKSSPYMSLNEGYVHLNSANNCRKNSKNDCDHFDFSKLLFGGVQYVFNREAVQFDIDIFDDTTILKESEVPPFKGKVTLYATIQDDDGVGYNAPDNRYDLEIPFLDEQDSNIYQGRVLLKNTAVADNDDPVKVTAVLQYFNGQAFVPNTMDSCTKQALDWQHWHFVPKGTPIVEENVALFSEDILDFENATQIATFQFPDTLFSTFHLMVPLKSTHPFLGYPWVANGNSGILDPRAQISVGLAQPKGALFYNAPLGGKP